MISEQTTEGSASATRLPGTIFSSGLDNYGTFWRRLLARILDGLVFAPLTLSGHFLLLPGRGYAVLYAWNFFTISVFWMYCALMHARYGQTLGKRAVDVKVLDLVEGRIPSLEQAFLREIGGIVISLMWLTQFFYYLVTVRTASGGQIGGIPLQIRNGLWIWWSVLEIVTMLANGKRRAVHDFIAGTVVVRIDGR